MSRRWWPAVAVATVVLVFSLVPLDGAAGAGLGSVAVVGVGLDKLLHVVDYAALALALGYGFRERAPTTFLTVFAAAVAFGGVLELLQGPVPGRATSLADAVANTVGAAVGTAGWWVVGVVLARGD